jgi:anti-sigma factor RsiW
MDPAVSHDELRELLGVFALDAVEPAEAATVRAHLDECPRCRDEVAQHQQTAAMLANTGSQAPAALWDAIATRIEPPPTMGQRFPGLQRPSRPRPARGRRIRPRQARRAAALVAAAAIAVIAVLGVQVSRLDHRLNQVASASAAQGLSAAARTALLDPGGRRITLASARRGGPPAAELIAVAGGTAFLFNERLPALPAAETYQLWAMIDGQAISVGILGVHPATVAVSLTTTIAATNAFAITVEPAGGSVAPSRPPVASTVS